LRLDSGAHEWRNGPEIPFDLAHSALVHVQDGGVVLIGGVSSQGDYFNTLFYLPHGGENAVWQELPQRLEEGRNGHVAFLIPDNITDCTVN